MSTISNRRIWWRLQSRQRPWRGGRSPAPIGFPEGPDFRYGPSRGRAMTDLETLAKDRGIKYFLISYTDLFGTQRSKLVPAAAINAMAKAGAGFSGFATWLDMTPADSDMFVIPDPDSLIQLPWKPEVGWFAGNPWMNGKEVAHAPRNVLRPVLYDAAKDCFQ